MWGKSGILVTNMVEIVWVEVENILVISQAYPLGLDFCWRLFLM